MGAVTQDRWDIFAERMFCMEDADPMYYALARADLDTGTKMRVFVGWCTYYHPGIAAAAAKYQGEQFWRFLASQYDTAPRASERRHFRGAAGRRALQEWCAMYRAPERMVDENFGASYFTVRQNLQKVRLFGDYFYWKFADVQERVFGIPCDFTGAAEHSPKVPQNGARQYIAPQLYAKPEDVLMERIYADMLAALPRPLRLAPPRYDRPLNMQEAETIACVYHQYKGGGYTYGARTAKAYRRLSYVTSLDFAPIIEELKAALTCGLPYHPPEEE